MFTSKWTKGDFFLYRVGVVVIQRSGDQTMQLIASPHPVARTRMCEAVTQFPRKPSGHGQGQICIGRKTGKRALKRD
jgi:hypothetical protein